MLTAQEIDAGYSNGDVVLQGVTVTAAAGELVAVIGANGAGKTTLAKTLSRLLPIKRGTINFDGRSLNGVAPFRVARMGLAHVPQGRQIIPGLSVRDNLLVGIYGLGLPGEEIEERLRKECERFPILRQRLEVRGGALSGGEQQMLALSRALMMRPKALVLDEPSLGLAPIVVKSIFQTARALADEGMAVVLIEQAALLALSVADTGYVLQGGRVALSSTASELMRDENLVRSYLG